MTVYDLCLAWNWEYDADFAEMLDSACRSRGLSLLQVVPANLGGMLPFRVFLDRASDTDPDFMPLVRWACDNAAYFINPYEQARHTWDKGAMHLALIGAGLNTPHTIFLPPYNEQPVLPHVDLSPLGDSFTVKPAHGGGGEGVVADTTSMEQVLSARQEYPADTYLLQAHIASASLGSRPAWFRIIYCAGRIYPCWWDTSTHVYELLAPHDEKLHSLTPLYDITASIARLCKLDLFSTEVSLTPDGLFVVVDYVNDQIDLRLQSKAADGVPDEVVRDIAGRLAELALEHARPA